MGMSTRDSEVANNSDASFRAWAMRLHDMILEAGAVQTEDTGQLDISTAVKPANSTYAGYRVYRFNDSLQESAPIYFRIMFGSADYTGIPRTTVEVGIATNGAGVIANGMKTDAVFCSANVSLPPNTAQVRRSMACHGEGFFWIFTDRGYHNGGPMIAFAIMRSIGDDGLPNEEGFVLYRAGGSINSSHDLYAGCVAVSANVIFDKGVSLKSFCMIVFSAQSAAVGAEAQCYKHYAAWPRVRVNPYALTIDTSQIADGAEQQLQVIPGIEKNYISVGKGLGNTPGMGTSAAHGLMLPWE